MSVRSRWHTMFTFSISLLIFSLVVLSIIESWVVKHTAIIVELSISHFSSVSLCFIYFGALLLGALDLILMHNRDWMLMYVNTIYISIKPCSILCAVTNR